MRSIIVTIFSLSSGKLRLSQSTIICFILTAFLMGCGFPGGTVDLALANSRYAGIVVDAKTGKVIYAHKATAKRYPASITKVMTLYLLFEAMERGKLNLNSKIRMSKRAARQPPSKSYIKAGKIIRVRDAIKLLVVKSANDIAVAVAEKLGGSEKNFARMMTKKARQLGMRNTVFKSASGLHRSGQYTTAKDIATLGRALMERFPRKYAYFSTVRISFKKRTYRNHNKLLGKIRGVDGIKTGYTRVSGYNLLVSMKRDRRRVIIVVLGANTSRGRDSQIKLLAQKYLRYASVGKYQNYIVKRSKTGKSTNKKLVNVSHLIKPRPNFRVQTARLSAHSTIERITQAVASKSADNKTSTLKLVAPTYTQPRHSRLRHTDINQSGTKQADINQSGTKQADINQSGTKQADITRSDKMEKARAVKSDRLAALLTNPPLPPQTIKVHPASKKIEIPYVPSGLAVREERETIVIGNGSNVLSFAPIPRLTSKTDKGVNHRRNPVYQAGNGWKIQVGAVPNRQAASRLLSKVQIRFKSVLGKARPVTETTTKNQLTLYRARLVGFKDKTAARGACQILVKNNQPCLAIKN